MKMDSFLILNSLRWLYLIKKETLSRFNIVEMALSHKKSEIKPNIKFLSKNLIALCTNNFKIFTYICSHIANSEHEKA
jgi:hypothetical protein